MAHQAASGFTRIHFWKINMNFLKFHSNEKNSKIIFDEGKNWHMTIIFRGLFDVDNAEFTNFILTVRSESN